MYRCSIKAVKSRNRQAKEEAVPLSLISTEAGSCLLCGSETWAMRAELESKKERTEMMMMRWMCGDFLILRDGNPARDCEEEHLWS